METDISEYVRSIPVLQGVDHDELSLLMKDCGITSLNPGDFMYRYGDYGEDCGLVLSGSLSVKLGRREDEAELKAGDIFGEIAALSGYARTADVVAREPSKVLVISRGTLLKLFDKFPPVKSRIDDLYRQRVLSGQFRSAHIFMGLPEDLVDRLAGTATLHAYMPGETVFHQGEEADAFYLVRYGFVKVTESTPAGGSRVLAYLKGGHYFGELALLNEGDSRMATVTVIDRTELVRISRDDFLHIIDSYPRIRAGLEKNIEKIKEQNTRIRQDEYLERTMSSIIESGFVRSKEVLVIDLTKCIQCNSCVRACGSLHDNQSRLVRKGMRLNNVLLIATSCRHCDDPTCMIKCPTGSITRGSAGEIYYSDVCLGCGKCARNCPYGNIAMVSADVEQKKGKRSFPGRLLNREKDGPPDTGGEKKRRPKKQPVKCDMCRDYPFTACAYNCPTGAARRMDPENFIRDIIGAG